MDIFENEEQEPMVSYYWKGLALFLLGMLTGFVFSPIKNGLSIGCKDHGGKKRKHGHCCGHNRDLEEYEGFDDDYDDLDEEEFEF